MYLSDNDIRNEVKAGRLVITPFQEEQVREVDGNRVLSFGTSPAGYDVRLQHEWKVFKNRKPAVIALDPGSDNINTDQSDTRVIDPLNFDESIVEVRTGNELILQPLEYALASTLEHFEIPNNIVGTWMAKSTYARCGLLFNTTPVQPGFKGNVVMEFFNATSFPMIIRADQGFAQVLFAYTHTPAWNDYSIAGGYHQQVGVQLPKV